MSAEVLEHIPLPVAVVELGSDARHVLFNREFIRVFGYTVDELQGSEDWVRAVYPDPVYRAEVMGWWREAVERAVGGTRIIRSPEIRVRAKDGGERLVVFHANVLEREIVIAVEDLTEARQAAARLEEARRAIESTALEVTRHIPGGAYAIRYFPDGSSRVEFVSQRFVEITGIEDRAILQAAVEPHFELIHPDDRAGFEELLWAETRDGENFEWEGRLVVRGQTLWVSAVSSPVPCHDGSVVWHGLLTDISARKRAEQALREALAREHELRGAAERANQAKSRFLAAISHEIRTPLSALVGLTEALLAGSIGHDLPGPFLGFLGRVRSGGQYLNLILRNLLDVSSIESGRPAVQPEEFYVADWVADTANILEPIAGHHGVRLEWELPADDEQRFCSDPFRLTQILLNLAHNAIKFSGGEGRRVRIAVDVEEERLVFSVSDEGPGIAEERIETLFLEYEQSVQRGPAFDRGVGLGLSVVKENTALLRGEVGACNRVPQGMCFKVVVPWWRGGDAAALRAANG